ncbi:MAG TPA: hypothetical protein VF032_11455 [Thermoleophilaceae bacterium]
MTLWLTLLLVWTAGIPAALFLTAFVAVRLNQRRAHRLPSFAFPESLRASPAPSCGRRIHTYRSVAGHGGPPRPRVAFRRRV